ncbi:hypothetical protein ASE91_08495 [Sphingomonas sp. Leaf62]|nr:hypothetical protein ASE91_08495 [Sphingomonas sp. Leaf62]
MMCEDDDIRQLLAVAAASPGDALPLAERLIAAHPGDARLHFFRGSMLAGSARPIEAHAALSRAVALAPDFALARFQLGFFELTSGEPARAQATWEKLSTLPDDHYLRQFVTGLIHLIHDRFADAIAALDGGIAANAETPPLNHDMQLIIDQCRPLLNPAAEAEEASPTSFLLGQLGRGSLH